MAHDKRKAMVGIFTARGERRRLIEREAEPVLPVSK